MDIYQYAMDMEQESKKYYRELGENCGNTELKSVFELLADEEVKHYNVLKAMRQGSTKKEVDSNLVRDVKAVFDEIRAKGHFTCSLDQTEAYKQAQQVEQKTRAYYMEQAEKADTTEEKGLFTRIAGEEEKHYWLLDNIIVLVQRPEQWLEDREWAHWEEY